MNTSTHMQQLVRQALQDNLAGGGLAPMLYHLEKDATHYGLHVRIPGLSAKQLRAELVNEYLLIYSYGHALLHGTEQLKQSLFMRLIPLPQDVVPSGIRGRIFSKGIYLEIPRKQLPPEATHRSIEIAGNC